MAVHSVSGVAPSHDTMRAVANGLKDRVMHLYAQAANSSEGYHEVAMSLGGLELTIGMFVDTRAALLRAIADKVIVGSFSWQVLESHGGSPELVITGYTAFYPL